MYFLNVFDLKLLNGFTLRVVNFLAGLAFKRLESLSLQTEKIGPLSILLLTVHIQENLFLVDFTHCSIALIIDNTYFPVLQ
jgi:hypothetical protein